MSFGNTIEEKNDIKEQASGESYTRAEKPIIFFEFKSYFDR